MNPDPRPLDNEQYNRSVGRVGAGGIQDKIPPGENPPGQNPPAVVGKIHKQLKQPACNSIVFKYLATNSGQLWSKLSS